MRWRENLSSIPPVFEEGHLRQRVSYMVLWTTQMLTNATDSKEAPEASVL